MIPYMSGLRNADGLLAHRRATSRSARFLDPLKMVNFEPEMKSVGWLVARLATSPD